MVKCPSCELDSTVDSRFCRGCGGEFPADALEKAQAESQALLTEGRRVFEDGRFEESIAFARSCLDSNPTSAEAHALLGDALERTGDVHGALQAYERVVELDPDSALDRVKLTYLRQLFAQPVPSTPAPRRKVAIAAASAAALTVMTFGSVAALMRGTPTEPTKGESLAPVQSGVSRMDSTAQPVNDEPTTTEESQKSKAESTDSMKPIREEDQARRVPTATSPTPGVRPHPAINGSLPDPGTNSVTGSLAPMPVAGIAKATPEEAKSKPKANVGDPDPTPTRTPTKPKDSPGIIDIRASDDSKAAIGGSQDVSANDADNMVRIGRQHLMAEDFSRAADAFERALAAGADPGSINQRLAQCYEKLGRRSEAITAYQRAIAAYQSRIDSGKGNERHKSALAACQQAVRVLGG